MSLDDHVEITVNLGNAGVARLGFKLPMILSHVATFGERIRYYSSVAELIDDNVVPEDGGEVRAATKMMAQSPHVKQFAIGRAVGDVTQRYALALVLASDAEIYKLKVCGVGFDDTIVTVTPTGGDGNDDIIGDLVTQLQAVVGRNYTATVVPGASDTDTLLITGTAANNWFSVEVLDPRLMTIAQTHADANVDDDLTAIELVDSSWYGLVTLYNSRAYCDTVAEWIEARVKTYYCASGDTESIIGVYTVNVSADVLAGLMDDGRRRTIGIYHASPCDFADAALAGKLMPKTPGTWTAKFKDLASVTPDSLTTTHRNNLKARRANFYVTEAGRRITAEGTVADTVFGFFDVVVGVDAFVDDLQKSIFGVMLAQDKIAYTDEGIASIESAARASANRWAEIGVLRTDPAPSVTFPRVADIDPSVRALRELPDGAVNAELAGAVHKTSITVNLTE